tara:strand:+ start:7712 stop:8203 length:492 start_codon:yes stop_codon:yes gene_type:complete
MTNQKELLVKMVLDMWHSRIAQIDKIISEISDEKLMTEIAPGKNRGIYILGHLIAVNDKMPTLFVNSAILPLFPALYSTFFANPDKLVTDIPSVLEIKTYWKEVNSMIEKYFNSLTTDEWFQKHNSISTEEFAKEPNRNKLNIIISRTNHMSYHLGQLTLLLK